MSINKKEKKEKKFKLGDVILNIVVALAFLFLGMSIIIGVKFKENPEDAYLLGYKPVYILTGSMEPTLREKGVCIVKKISYDDVKVGDMIMFTIDEKTITHRVISKTEEGIRTKGDNNDVDDAFYLNDENIKAKVVFTMNITATIINDLEKGVSGYVKWFGYPLFVIIILITTSKIIKKIKTKEDKTKKDESKEENKSSPQE